MSILDHGAAQAIALRGSAGVLSAGPRNRVRATDARERKTEIGIGSYIEKDSVIKIQFATELREFKLQEKVIITATDFSDIGWGCRAFADELGKKLPKLEEPKTLRPLVICPTGKERLVATRRTLSICLTHKFSRVAPLGGHRTGAR